MYVYFNSNGQLLEKLEHGAPARSGTTNFEIFAYFDGIDITGNNVTASISLFKPDLEHTRYPALVMTKKINKKFVQQSGEHSKYFKDGYYDGFLIDFSDFDDEQTPVALIDMAGTWKATIRIFKGTNLISVQGQVAFNVGQGIDSEDEITGADILELFSDRTASL